MTQTELVSCSRLSLPCRKTKETVWVYWVEIEISKIIEIRLSMVIVHGDFFQNILKTHF